MNTNIRASVGRGGHSGGFESPIRDRFIREPGQIWPKLGRFKPAQIRLNERAGYEYSFENP